jgi:hypothetical protein
MSKHVYLKFCRCTQCRYGLRTKSGSEMVRSFVRADRRAVKRALHMGQDDELLPVAVSVPYTD